MSTQPPPSSSPANATTSAPEADRPDQKHKLNTKSDSHGHSRAGVHVDAEISPADNKADSPPQTPSPGASGKGMPAREPREQDDLTGKQTTQSDSATETHLELPSDRDQAADMTHPTPDPAVKQAARDVQKGIKDTSKGAETDKAYEKLRKED